MTFPWFRMYAEFATDTKVQSMDETLQRRFIMFLCLHCNGEYERLSDDELAFALRITTAELVNTKEVFKQKRFLGDNGEIRNWNKRQFKSDSSTERVREHRKRRRNGGVTGGNVSVTPSDSDSDSEKSTTAAKPPTRVSRETTPEWLLDFKLAYPSRVGDQGWRKAVKAANARIAEGHTPEEFIAGAKRYHTHMDALGKVGTEYVKQAATFLGPDKHFLDTWTVPGKINGHGKNPYKGAI